MHFFLRTRTSYVSGPAPIYMRVTVEGDRFEMATQREVDPAAKCDNKACRMVHSKKESTRELNHYPDMLQGRVFEAQREMMLKGHRYISCLTGAQQYHIVWETLDTEEATYIWSVDNHKSKLKEIDQNLGFIRSKGRQAFIDKSQDSFSRIIHGYTDVKKDLFFALITIQNKVAQPVALRLSRVKVEYVRAYKGRAIRRRRWPAKGRMLLLQNCRRRKGLQQVNLEKTTWAIRTSSYLPITDSTSFTAACITSTQLSAD